MDNQNDTNKKVANAKVTNQTEKDIKSINKKKRRRNVAIIAVASVVIGGGTLCVINPNNMLHGFAGVGEIVDQDATLKAMQDPTSRLKGAKAINASSGSAPIKDIASFQQAISENVQSLMASNENSIAIPSVGVLFQLASSDICNNEMVREYAKIFLQTNQESSILVEGYTCDLGTNESNMVLSKQRAEAVKQSLIDCGVPEKNIQVKWYGESKYQQLGYSTKEEHRRVNVTIM